MEKHKYFMAIKLDNGHNDEVELGQSIGLDHDSTMRIISTLLSEYKIEYKSNGLCNYKVK